MTGRPLRRRSVDGAAGLDDGDQYERRYATQYYVQFRFWEVEKTRLISIVFVRNQIRSHWNSLIKAL